MDDLYWRLVDVLQALAAALLVGGTYGLMCVGLGIIFGVMRVVTFAHGDFWERGGLPLPLVLLHIHTAPEIDELRLHPLGPCGLSRTSDMPIRRRLQHVGR